MTNVLMAKYLGTDDFPTCPICGLQDTIQRPNIHVKTRYDESIFGLYILQDPSALWNLTDVGHWMARTLGPEASLCLEERPDGNVNIHGTMLKPGGQGFTWVRVSSPLILIQIFKDESLFNILLDPSIVE